ncbi:polyphosphate kinase 2 family protein [Paenisporosarcina antarctica]|uniref:Polyphosphate kinase n=1 Tax=Paenisporosarcina antarctica TaxID=417367 RepID=A0A4P6ZVS6_9BACL|nr:polyphosphate kinase [Paenisporosarcina antarctica]QBP40343.1 polyphosphate kinase [Paenisporosarcina antarctica]
MNIRLNELLMDQQYENKKKYNKELKQLQFDMLNVQQHLFNEKVGLVLVFEGMDAAGKGGAIKRLSERLDPRGLRVHPIAAPQPHELRFHYLQRFWRKLPQHGQISIFDRSWYGRVLVERIEGFATKPQWKRAYKEITDFEKMLTDESYIVVKCWLHITQDEQLKRFEERRIDPNKQWKLTDEDWRNREKWTSYIEAAEEMFEKTNINYAPWIVVEANDKKYARIVVLKRILEHIMQVCVEKGIPVNSHHDVSQGEDA